MFWQLGLYKQAHCYCSCQCLTFYEVLSDGLLSRFTSTYVIVVIVVHRCPRTVSYDPQITSQLKASKDSQGSCYQGRRGSKSRMLMTAGNV